jgi:tRNA A37 methylthiotransferase MiaB
MRHNSKQASAPMSTRVSTQVSLKYYVEPLGCAKNQVDAETMMACLDAAGAEAADGPEDAALIIVNSCGFIEDAKREAINTVLEFRRLFPDKKIILSGCLARRYADELREDLTEADAVFADSNVGTATLIIKGINSYKGKMSVTFLIERA